jgi:hydrogenase expression/formation protein HypC
LTERTGLTPGVRGTPLGFPGGSGSSSKGMPRLVEPECHGDVCITCSDEAVPVRVVRLLDANLATVDTGQSLEEVSVALVDAAVGDTILVHAKEAIARLGGAASGS